MSASFKKVFKWMEQISNWSQLAAGSNKNSSKTKETQLSPERQLQLLVPAGVWSVGCGCLKHCALERNLHEGPHLHLTTNHKKALLLKTDDVLPVGCGGEVCCT